MEDILIWVNENDEEIGSGPKLETHRLKQLHRAFSLFLFDPDTNRILIQQRAHGKYHSGGLWANSCCSHPRKGETLAEAVPRRAQQELGILAEGAEELGSFVYFKDFGELAEHEVDHVFLCDLPETTVLHPDPEEIAELRWVEVSALERETREHPERFSAWFCPAFSFVLKALKKRKEA